MTFSPFRCRSGITLLHDEPSAQAPWTSTTLTFDSMFFSFLSNLVSITDLGIEEPGSAARIENATGVPTE